MLKQTWFYYKISRHFHIHDFHQEHLVVKHNQILSKQYIGKHEYAFSTTSEHWGGVNRKETVTYGKKNPFFCISISIAVSHVFLWLCVWCGSAKISVVSYVSRESWVFVSITPVQSVMYANNRVHYGLEIMLVCLHIYTISLSSLCRLIWSHWTCKMLIWYILLSVCPRIIPFS